MNQFILEICVDSVESAINAHQAGASRIELCGNLVIGGTTPDICLMQAIQKHCNNLPIHVLLRPRFGDFLYTDYEFEVLKENVKLFKKQGAAAVVIGILKADGTLDLERMKELIALARPMKVTLHRAFDMVKDPIQTLEDAISLGIDTILTSGQQDNSLHGIALLKQLKDQAGDRIEVLVGAGVSAQTILEIHQKTGATSFHMSGKVSKDSLMEYRKECVHMGLPGISEYERLETAKEAVLQAKEVLLNC